jgi:hypothetical protein
VHTEKQKQLEMTKISPSMRRSSNKDTQLPVERWGSDTASPLQFSTPCLRIFPENIRVLPVPMNVIVPYQKAMASCKWKPAWGHKLGFLVVHGDALLGILALVSPVIRLTARDEHLFPEAKLGPAFTGDPKFHFNKKGKLVFDYGSALRSYMDMSVCVAAQPIGWHWNIGKLLAMIATTLGDFVEERYPDDNFVGVTTTSVYGGETETRKTQYSDVYQYLGETKGYGSEQIGDDDYQMYCACLRASGWIPGCRFEDGSNPKMRRIAAYRKLSGDKTVTLQHGHKRGVYYQPAVPPEDRDAVIREWFTKYGLPRYKQTMRRNARPCPYQDVLADAVAS